MDKARRGLLLAIAAISAASIILQFYLTMTTRNLDHSLVWRVVDFVSYFTIPTNLLIVAVALACLWRPQSWLARPSVAAATAVYAVVLGISYQWLLRAPKPPHSLALFTDTGLHEIAPTLYLLTWLFLTPKPQLRWSLPAFWLVYPVGYILWVMARGAVIHRYPYPFIDPDKLGYPHVLATIAMFMLAFYAVGLLIVAAERFGGRLVGGRAAV